MAFSGDVENLVVVARSDRAAALHGASRSRMQLMHHERHRGHACARRGGVAISIALFICTAMIYACIRFLQEWAHPLTVINFILLGCASGYTFAAAYASLAAPALEESFIRWAVIFTVAAFVTRAASLVRNRRIKPKSSLQTAIGVKHPKVVQKSQGFMGGSFNTREFFHGRTASLVRARPVVLPELRVCRAGRCYSSRRCGGTRALLAIAAFVVQYAGLIAERWYFFAQARHPQNLYYQTIS